MADDLLRFDELEQVIYTPLAENEQLRTMAWQVIAEAVGLFKSIARTCRHESESGALPGTEKNTPVF